MKSKGFLAHLGKIVSAKKFTVDGKAVTKVISLEGNVLKCEVEGTESEFAVEQIVASKQAVGSGYDLVCQASKKEKKPAKKTKKEDKTLTEDKE